MTMTAVQSASPLSLNRSEISVEIHQTASISNHVNTQIYRSMIYPTHTPHHPITGGARGGGVAQWLERQTRDRKVAGSNPCRSGGRIFVSGVDFLC